jgi:hypothetical protein
MPTHQWSIGMTTTYYGSGERDGTPIAVFDGEEGIDNVPVSVSTSSTSAAVAGSGNTLLVWNPSAALAYLKAGVGAQTATALNGELIPPGLSVVKIKPSDTHIGLLLSTGTGAFVVRRGTGS